MKYRNKLLATVTSIGDAWIPVAIFVVIITLMFAFPEYFQAILDGFTQSPFYPIKGL